MHDTVLHTLAFQQSRWKADWQKWWDSGARTSYLHCDDNNTNRASI